MSVPPRQPRPNRPSTTNTGGARSATTTATTASGPNTADVRRTSVFQQDQDSGAGVGSSSSTNPFVSRRHGGGRPSEQQQQQRHDANSINNSTPSHRPVATRRPGAPPPAPRPTHTAPRLPIATPPPPAPRLTHAVTRPVDERTATMVEDDPSANRSITTPRIMDPRCLRRGRHNNLGFDSPELGASPITPFDTMFTPNTQVLETAGIGIGIGVTTTPVTARLTETFSSTTMSAAEDSQEGGSTSITTTMSSFIKRPSRIALEEEDDQSENGDDIHPGDKVMDDDDVESFLSKRESLIRGRRAIEKQPRRLQSHTGPHDIFYSSPSASMATPEGFTTPQHRSLPPSLLTQTPARTAAMAGPSRFQPLLSSRDEPDTPVGRNRSHTRETSSLWTNAGRRAMLGLKRQYQRDNDGVEGTYEDTSQSGDAVATSTSADSERDPFLETPRPPGRDGAGIEDQEQEGQEEQEDDFDYDRDILLDDADLEQDFESTADTAFISEDHGSLAESNYESEEVEKERRKKAAIIRANRSFELNMKAARVEAEAEVKAKMAAAEAADTQGTLELLEASVETEQEEEEEEEVEESEEKILRRQLEAELEDDLENYEESSFQELADSEHHLSSTASLLNELVQERNGRQLTTPEELECRSWMYEVGRVGRPQRVGVWARV